VSSMGGEFSTPFSGIYHASKYAVEAISDALRIEVAPFGVNVIVIQPGVVQTRGDKSALDGIPTRVNSPYAAALARFRRFLLRNASPEDETALSPEAVAQVIVQAVSADHPLARYKVGAEAEQLTSPRRKLSDQEWDAIYRKLFWESD
jgi:NAD(P)-dependent dehydrogenase (short-subunit alcohol dehydrogenase family)